ncbi:unnamed protein product [Strongylus vulgaris]|uniref:Uncharacterized protein n=1 Tax=Strongylus vulgaris TaxID=40348 RepID=A0A3P7KPB3_STRVU|nr:unnamed protein product [Strongylus vulgaris]
MHWDRQGMRKKKLSAQAHTAEESIVRESDNDDVDGGIADVNQLASDGEGHSDVPEVDDDEDSPNVEVKQRKSGV